jgi:hypothetical protein
VASFYAVYPFLPSAAKRAERLGIDVSNLDDLALTAASDRFRQILLKRFNLPVLDEKAELTHFILFRIFASILGSEYYYDLLGKFYAERARIHNPSELFVELGIDPEAIPLAVYMSYRHVYPETKLYYTDLRKGVVRLDPDRAALFAGDIAYTLSTRGLPLDVSNLPKHFADYARRAVPVRRSKPQNTKGYSYIESILSASGIPDGRKRIIFFWLAPYLVNVKGMHPDEAVSVLQEWLSRQGGAKIPPSWVKDEALLAKRKGIRPWGLKKVESADPALVKMLRDMGVI